MTDEPIPVSAGFAGGEDAEYTPVRDAVGALLESARRASARAVNAVMTATYWEVGRRIVEYEQGGEERAAYGWRLLARTRRVLESRGA